MACPFFHPAAEEFVDAPGWHPLGDAHRGSCQANPREPFQPSDRTLHDLCNLGYAALTCPRFPANADADAVRFTIARDDGGVIGLYYVAEKNHLPQSHGPLEYSRAAGAFTIAHTDAILQWQAEAYQRAIFAANPMHAKPVRESASEYSELALPNDANLLGNLLGGKVMHLVDVAAALAAIRHARCPVVTASIDHMNFLHPVKIGQLVLLRSSVNRAFRTSMEVGVKIFVEDLTTGERRHTSSAYLTFVALDAHGNRVPVPQVIPESDDEKRRYEEADKRRTYRLQIREKSRL